MHADELQLTQGQEIFDIYSRDGGRIGIDGSVSPLSGDGSFPGCQGLAFVFGQDASADLRQQDAEKKSALSLQLEESAAGG